MLTARTGGPGLGGYSGELQASLSELWLLNFETTEWIQLQSEVDEAIPEPRAGHTGVMLGHSRMVSPPPALTASPAVGCYYPHEPAVAACREAAAMA